MNIQNKFRPLRLPPFLKFFSEVCQQLIGVSPKRCSCLLWSVWTSSVLDLFSTSKFHMNLKRRKARQEKNRKQFRKFLIVYLFRINPLFVHCTGTNEQHVRNVYLPFPFCVTASWFPSLLFQFQSSSGVKYIRCFVQRTKKGSKKILFFIYKEQKHYKKQ